MWIVDLYKAEVTELLQVDNGLRLKSVAEANKNKPPL